MQSIIIYINKPIDWNHPIFKEYAQNQQEQDDYIKTPVEVEEGVVECIKIKCKSKRVFSTSVQTRASDEPLTTVAQCTQCGHKWWYNA